MNATQTAQHVMTGATIGGGTMQWLAANASAITAIAVLTTAVASIVFGFVNAKANRDRNKVNRRDIIAAIMKDLETAGKSKSYISDIKYIFDK